MRFRLAIDRMGSALTVAERISLVACCVLIVVIVALVSYMMLFRAVPLGVPSAWVVEVVEYSMVYVAFLPLSYIQSKREHITVSLLPQRMVRHKSFRIFAAVRSAAIAFGIATFAWFAMQALVQYIANDVTIFGIIEVNRAALMAPVALGCLLLVSRLVVDALAGLDDSSTEAGAAA